MVGSTLHHPSPTLHLFEKNSSKRFLDASHLIIGEPIRGLLITKLIHHLCIELVIIDDRTVVYKLPIGNSKTEVTATSRRVAERIPIVGKRLRVYTLHNSKNSNSWLNKCCYCFFHRSGSKSLYFSSGVFGCHSMVFSMTSLMYSNRLMPFNLHEIAIEYRIAPRLAPSCEPKNIEFLLDSDMYLWILSI